MPTPFYFIFAAMLFRDVIGQAETKKKLVNLVKQNRMSHALLFLGNEGCGALPLALSLVQFMVCDKVNGSNASTSLFGEPAPPDLSSPMHAVCALHAKKRSR